MIDDLNDSVITGKCSSCLILEEKIARLKGERDEAVEQVKGMQGEGCAAADLVQNIFNGLTSPSALVRGASLKIQAEMADACATLLTEASQCDHKERAEAAERNFAIEHDALVAAEALVAVLRTRLQQNIGHIEHDKKGHARGLACPGCVAEAGTHAILDLTAPAEASDD